MTVAATTRHCGVLGVKPYYDADIGLWIFARMAGFNYALGDASGGYVDMAIYPGPAAPMQGIVPELEFWWRLHHFHARSTHVATSSRTLLILGGRAMDLQLGGRNSPGYQFTDYLTGNSWADGYSHNEYSVVRDANIKRCIPFCHTVNNQKLSTARYMFLTNTDTKDYEFSIFGEMLQTEQWLKSFGLLKNG